MLELAVIDLVKTRLKPYWRDKHITREKFKFIMRKVTDKVCRAPDAQRALAMGDNKGLRTWLKDSRKQKILGLVDAYLEKSGVRVDT